MDTVDTILNSHTFKESRKMYRIRLVPDRIDAINLRIYNKSDFVTDVLLKELEKKLNTELESIAREKYFEGIDKGLDYSIVEKYERLKRGDSDDLRPRDVLVMEAKQNLLDEKHSSAKKIGSIWQKDEGKGKSDLKHQNDQTIDELSLNWMDDTTLDQGLPDLTSKRQMIVDKKGIAVSDVLPAKYSKEHAAASLYFFINFTMPVTRRQELLDSKILENEADFDEVIRGLKIAFEENYDHFETSHQPPDFLTEDTDLERHYKHNERKKKSKKDLKKEEEERKRYLRCTCTPEEALELVARDMAEVKENKSNIVRNGLVVRNDAIEVDDNYKNKRRSKFLRAAEHGIWDHTSLGPTLDTAVEEVMTKYQDQIVFNDKISFFRMEYFLYSMRELHLIDQDAFHLKEDISHYKKKMSEKDAEIQRLRFNFQRATLAEREELEKNQKDYNEIRKKIQSIDEELDIKKSIIKQLVGHILKWKIKAKRTYGKDHFGVSLNTFWLPLDLQEDIDTEYDKEEYRLNETEKVKKSIVYDNTRSKDPKIRSMAVEDYTTDAKYRRTMLGYHNFADGNEELVFKKLVPSAEKVSNEILEVIPYKIRQAFRQI